MLAFLRLTLMVCNTISNVIEVEVEDKTGFFFVQKIFSIKHFFSLLCFYFMISLQYTCSNIFRIISEFFQDDLHSGIIHSKWCVTRLWLQMMIFVSYLFIAKKRNVVIISDKIGQRYLNRNVNKSYLWYCST